MIQRLLPALSLVDRFSQERYRTLSARVLRRAGVTVEGLPLWVSPRVYFDIAKPGSITIGDRAVISHYVRLLTHDFSLDRVAEQKFGVSDREVAVVRPVTVGKQAFIGMGALLMPGVTVGEGSIVGAGSIVTKSIPAGEAWAGNPARRLCTTEELWEKRSQDSDLVWQQRRP